MNDGKKYHGQEEREAHALAMGKIVMAWNEYHETLGQLFAKLFARNQYGLALTAWQALNNDRAQRTMLAEVARVKFKPGDKAGKEILWLVEKTNQMISDQRNLGIHTPLMSFTDLDGIHQMLPADPVREQACSIHARSRSVGRVCSLRNPNPQDDKLYYFSTVHRDPKNAKTRKSALATTTPTRKARARETPMM